MSKLIRYSCIAMLCLCANNILNAQSEPEPYWYSDRSKLNEGSNFVYIVGVGRGSTEKSAKKEALDEALRDAIAYLRNLNIFSDVEIDNLKVKMNDDSNEGYKIVCADGFNIKNDENKHKVYILYRFKKNIYQDFGDNDAPDICDAQFKIKRERYYKSFTSSTPSRINTYNVWGGQQTKTECYTDEQVWENPSVFERKTESTEGIIWQYYVKNDIIVAQTRTNTSDDYGQYKVEIIISNNSSCPIEFEPERDITGYWVDKKNVKKELNVYSQEKYNKKVETIQNRIKVAEELTRALNTNNTNSIYTNPTRNTYNTTNTYAYQRNVYNLNFLKNQQNYINVQDKGYLKRNTIQPGETIYGYVYVEKPPVSITIKTKINGAENINAKYVYE